MLKQRKIASANPATVKISSENAQKFDESSIPIKSVGASISLPSQKAQTAILIEPPPLPNSIDETKLPENEIQKNSKHSVLIPPPNVIVKRIERNPNSRNEMKAIQNSDSSAADSEPHVERRIIVNEPAQVKVVTVVEGNVETLQRRKSRQQQGKRSKSVSVAGERGKIGTGNTSNSRVRFDLDGNSAAGLKETTKKTTIGENSPTSILRKPSGASEMPTLSEEEIIQDVHTTLTQQKITRPPKLISTEPPPIKVVEDIEVGKETLPKVSEKVVNEDSELATTVEILSDKSAELEEKIQQSNLQPNSIASSKNTFEKTNSQLNILESKLSLVTVSTKKLIPVDKLAVDKAKKSKENILSVSAKNQDSGLERKTKKIESNPIIPIISGDGKLQDAKILHEEKSVAKKSNQENVSPAPKQSIANNHDVSKNFEIDSSTSGSVGKPTKPNVAKPVKKLFDINDSAKSVGKIPEDIFASKTSQNVEETKFLKKQSDAIDLMKPAISQEPKLNILKKRSQSMPAPTPINKKELIPKQSEKIESPTKRSKISNASSSETETSKRRKKSISEPPKLKSNNEGIKEVLFDSKIYNSLNETEGVANPISHVKNSKRQKTSELALFSDNTKQDKSKIPLKKKMKRLELDGPATPLENISKIVAENSKSQSKPTIASEKKLTPPKDFSIANDPNSRLQRTLKLRARLQLEVDGVFAMGLCAPSESDLAANEIPDFLLPKETAQPSESLELKSTTSFPNSLPLKRHPSARRSVIKVIGYPATGISMSTVDSEFQAPKTVYKFRRSKSLEDASKAYNIYRQSHPLPFGHYGDHDEIRAIQGNTDIYGKLVANNQIKGYEKAMIESFGFLPMFNDQVRRPTTVPNPDTVVNIDLKQETPRKLYSAQEAKSQHYQNFQFDTRTQQPLANTSENPVGYLQQYMDRVKKGGNGPVILARGQSLSTLGQLDGFPRRPAPPPMREKRLPAARDKSIGREKNFGQKLAPITAEDASRNNMIESHCNSERYSDIVTKRNGWERGIPFEYDGIPKRGRAQSRRRENTPADQIRTDDLISVISRTTTTPRKKSLERRAYKSSKSRKEDHMFNGPFEFPAPRSSSSHDTRQNPKRKIIKSERGFSKIKRITKSKNVSKTNGKLPRKIESKEELQDSPYIPNTVLKQQFQNQWYSLFSYPPSGGDPINTINENQLMQPQYSWAFSEIQPHQTQNPVNHDKESDLQSKSDSPSKTTKQKKLKTEKMKTQTKRAASNSIPQKRSVEPVISETVLPQYDAIHSQKKQFFGESRPIVPPNLLPARIQVQQVPVIVMRQAMVIEPTGDPPGSIAEHYANIGEAKNETDYSVHPAFISSQFFGNSGIYHNWQPEFSVSKPPEEFPQSKKPIQKQKQTGVRAMIQKGIIGRHKIKN
ncbi:hypothetical protein HK100_011141 [Physocladia obscura]|uniref:Uncharacterized protein n=1 Tax=Physocladia obscura TaxID=109957 RepID=A0AAD5T1N1_9FUNG|nr:hypothetical protein HK100_011141 [Physocladia obscura]